MASLAPVSYCSEVHDRITIVVKTITIPFSTKLLRCKMTCLINLSVAANFETHLGAPADLFVFKATRDCFCSVAACDC